ncbi:MAG: orotidine 5'-phosphate decarboxylase [Thermofilaceae archaeon]|nr:orotidine 5'-phosphate decarboxylase [Thermofilaceae archaeon]MCX8180817.1 orotidine 5'-phosphate decarboxylase [Thermofilaceae archaeon]MDW8004603.1 orotidine 5'-phosphate decarboxylase / HUMPS family protein [Thermofilaceae archaeon]
MKPDKLWELAGSKNSRLIVALDNIPSDPTKLVNSFKEFAVGVKIGLPFLLKWGPSQVKHLCNQFGNSLYMLCDLKLADIPFIVAEEVKLIDEYGFDGLIVHLFQGGIREVSSLPSRPDLFGLVSMTHKESRLIDEHFKELLEEALASKLEGCVAPATKPEIIRAAKKLAPELTLISPGIGAQGVQAGAAIEAGADFEIIGRAIVSGHDPGSVARAMRDAMNVSLKKVGEM